MLGKRVSHYRILESIGRGGMGEVFLAQDTILDRKVALKFLATKIQQDDTAQKRFLREAKAAASLDHPYICKIYEVGEDLKRSFISMEYVPGTTLKERLTRGLLPLHEALEIALEIAEALEEAHKKNMVHRDIKPSNIMLTVGGHVKVMDFGLAKYVAPPEYEGEDITSDLTQAGCALGTVPYMSPEQIRGLIIDTRSDIFSFGVLLYEMLAGLHPFRRVATMDTAQAILSEKAPPLRRYTDEVPELLQHVIKKMLSKEPDGRYQLIHEVRTDLEELSRRIERLGDDPISRPNQEVTEPMGEFARPSMAKLQDVGEWAGPEGEKKPQPRKLYYVGAGSVCMVVLILVVGLWVPKEMPESVPDLIVESAPPEATVVQEPPPLPNEVLTPSGVMVRVKGGEPLSPSGEAGRVVSADFFIDRYEVTNTLFKRFCDQTGRSYPPDPQMMKNYFLAKQDYPVVNVTWEEATAFCHLSGKHLPSLQEWEKAARSLDDRVWPWGNEQPTGQANLGGKQDGSEFMTSVAAFPLDISPYGVEQMAGNVAEWAVNFDERLLREVPVIKGGSWVNQLADYGKTSPVVARFKPEDRRRMNGVGFRCAASTEEINRFLQVAERGLAQP